MQYGRIVNCYFTDAVSGERKARPAVANAGAGDVLALFIFAAAADAVPADASLNVPRSSEMYSDDPDRAAAEQSCWSPL